MRFEPSSASSRALRSTSVLQPLPSNYLNWVQSVAIMHIIILLTKWASNSGQPGENLMQSFHLKFLIL